MAPQFYLWPLVMIMTVVAMELTETYAINAMFMAVAVDNRDHNHSCGLRRSMTPSVVGAASAMSLATVVCFPSTIVAITVTSVTTSLAIVVLSVTLAANTTTPTATAGCCSHHHTHNLDRHDHGLSCYDSVYSFGRCFRQQPWSNSEHLWSMSQPPLPL